MGLVNTIYYIFVFFLLTVIVWTLAVGYFYSDAIAVEPGMETQGITEEEVDLYYPSLPKTSSWEGAWNSTHLLEEGQKFDYHVTLSNSEIDLIYEVKREMRDGYIIRGWADIKKEGQFKGRFSEINISIPKPIYDESFFILKRTRAPRAETYTSSFWNFGLCYPIKYFFWGQPLVSGASWNITLPEERMAFVEVGRKSIVNEREGIIALVSTVGNDNSLAIDTNIPLPLSAKGDWCFFHREMLIVLRDYTPGE